MTDLIGLISLILWLIFWDLALLTNLLLLYQSFLFRLLIFYILF